MQPLPTIHQAIVDLLEANGPVDLSRKAAGGGWQGEPGASIYTPHTIVWPTGARPEGTLAGLHTQGHAVVQLSTFGASPQSAGARAQANRELLVASLVIPDCSVSSVEHLLSRGPTEHNEAGVNQAVWMVVDQFDIWTT